MMFKLLRIGARVVSTVAECDHLEIRASKSGASIVTRTGKTEHLLEIPADQINSVIERLHRCKNLNDQRIIMRDLKA